MKNSAYTGKEIRCISPTQNPVGRWPGFIPVPGRNSRLENQLFRFRGEMVEETIIAGYYPGRSGQHSIRVYPDGD